MLMDHKRPKILAIVPDPTLYQKISPILERDGFEVSRAANATGSLILATNVGYDLIVAVYPLPDLSIVDFLGILQAPTLPSADSRILLLAADDQVAGIRRHVEGNEHITVMPQSAAAESLQDTLAECLSSVSARKNSRLMVQLETEVDSGKMMRLCQTSNVSESGMLIHTSRLVPLESEVVISFFLPGDPRPIAAAVKVVRHTDPAKEKVRGMGVVFTSLQRPSRDKLREFVTGRWVAPEDSFEPGSAGPPDPPKRS